MSDTKTIGLAVLRELAVRASCDPRSVKKVLSGGELRGHADVRVRRVLAAEGLLPRQSEAGEHAIG